MSFKYLDALEKFLRATADTTEINETLGTDIDEAGFINYNVGEESFQKYNIFRKLATFLNVSKTDGKILVPVSDDIAGIMEENAPFPVSEHEFEEKGFSSYKLGTIVKVKQDFISDYSFNLIDYLDGELAKRFGKAEEKLMLNGSGNKEPLGLLNQDLSCFVVNDLSYDAIIDFYFSLSKEYRDNACFIVSDEIAIELRKLKDSDGNYIWNQSNDTILGKPVYVSSYMNDETKPILFGDFSYLSVILRGKMKLKVLNELFANKFEIGYAVKERLDFKLTQADAVRVLLLDSSEESED